VPDHLAARRGEVVARLRELEARVRPVTEFLSNEGNVKLLKQDKAQNLAFLHREFGIGAVEVEALYAYAKWNFECGNYGAAAEYLYHYRSLSTNPERAAGALWGRAAANILLQDFDAAVDDLAKLKEVLDVDTFAPVAAQLAAKAWLMHASLFAFFNHENGMNALIDLFTQDRYAAAMQLAAPHLLRYLAAAVVVNRRRRAALKDLVRLIAQERYEYADPVTEFLRLLFVEADFEGARAALAAAADVMDADFFLVGTREAFVEAGRQFLFEAYCRCHRQVSLATLSEQLGMDAEATEKWLVDLIRGARLAARIDSKAGTVVIQTAAPSAREQLLERARGLSLRTFGLANTVVGMLRAQ
jgi:translation initiation factor 3 subunit E